MEWQVVQDDTISKKDYRLVLLELLELLVLLP